MSKLGRTGLSTVWGGLRPPSILFQSGDHRSPLRWIRVKAQPMEIKSAPSRLGRGERKAILMNQSNVDLPWAGRRRRARLLLFALIGVPSSLMEGKRRFIRLRHLPEKLCPDFVPSSCNTQSISAKKRLSQASIFLAICSCLMNHRLPKVSGWLALLPGQRPALWPPAARK